MCNQYDLQADCPFYLHTESIFRILYISLFFEPVCPRELTLTNGIVAYIPTTGDLVPGSTATHRCDPGYVLVGVSVRNCQADGTWSGVPPTCEPIGKKICVTSMIYKLTPLYTFILSQYLEFYTFHYFSSQFVHGS